MKRTPNYRFINVRPVKEHKSNSSKTYTEIIDEHLSEIIAHEIKVGVDPEKRPDCWDVNCMAWGAPDITLRFWRDKTGSVKAEQLVYSNKRSDK